MPRQVERVSEFQKMSYSNNDREKWRKVLVNQLMSSDKSDYENAQAVFVVKELPWRSSKVTASFEKLGWGSSVTKDSRPVDKPKEGCERV